MYLMQIREVNQNVFDSIAIKAHFNSKTIFDVRVNEWLNNL